MSTVALRSGMQDNAAGVATRSRRRLRVGADSSSPAADLCDRKTKPQLPSVPLRRSSRHAAKVASKAEGHISPTRHPEPTLESPSAVEEDSQTPFPSTREHGQATVQDIRRPELPTPVTRASSSHIPIPHDVEIIDLTESRAAQKRRWSTVIADDAGNDEPRRVTRSSSKHARLNGRYKHESITSSSFVGSQASSSVTRRGRTTKPISEAQSSKNDLLKSQVITLGLSEQGDNEIQGTERDNPRHAQSVHEAPINAGAPLPAYPTPSGPDLQSGDPLVEDVPSNSSLYPFSEYTGVQVEESDASGGSFVEQILFVECEASAENETGKKVDEVDMQGSASSPNPPVLCTSSNASSIADCPLTPMSPPGRYFGIDGRLLRSRKPPSSYLAPNPVRRAPRSQTVRRDEFRYLLHATEKAGLIAFAQTRRQFPRWMKRPSRIYFKGSEFYPRGRPATEQDMDAVEVGVGIDFDPMLVSSTTRDIFLLPQDQFYTSTSGYTTPQMELDPDLDPSSLLNSQSSFYASHAETDFGPGPSSSSVQLDISSHQQPQDHFWSATSLSMEIQAPFAPSSGPHAGPSSGSSFDRLGSYSPEIPWNSSSWVNSPQFSLPLFGVPPLPVPTRDMTLDSSLSAMATYLVNDAPLKANLNPAALNVIDGIPSAPTPAQSYFAMHPIQQMDSNGKGDGYQFTPLN